MAMSTTVAGRINGEMVVVLGWGRAILLQLSHPLVAAGVADHSRFDGGPLAYLRRTHRTVGAMLALTFGPPEATRASADRINAIHRRVHGVLRSSARRFPVGTPYSATDPALLRWVHATLVESQLLAYERFVGPLASDERDQYCLEAAAVAPLLGIPDGYLPTDRRALHGYLEQMYANGGIEVTETARGLARALLYPPGGWVTGPAMPIGRLTTIGLLPDHIRAGYGLNWSARYDRRLRRATALVRGVVRVLPGAVRRWSAARGAGARRK